MILNEQQQQDVRDWVESGATLSDVQKRLRETHDVSITYMDLRLLVLELGAQLKDKPEPKVLEPAAPAAPSAEGGADDMDPDVAGTPGGVSVSMDRVMQAGALASGTVTFSDGVSAKWMLDQVGRLGLSSVSTPGYQPSPEDIQAFQLELQNKIAARGY